MELILDQSKDHSQIWWSYCEIAHLAVGNASMLEQNMSDMITAVLKHLGFASLINSSPKLGELCMLFYADYLQGLPVLPLRHWVEGKDAYQWNANVCLTVSSEGLLDSEMLLTCQGCEHIFVRAVSLQLSSFNGGKQKSIAMSSTF